MSTHRFSDLFASLGLLDGWPDVSHRTTHRGPFYKTTADNDYGYLQIDLPGVEADALELTVHSDQLTVAVERPRDDVAEGDRWLHQERPCGRWEQTFQLPFEAEASAIEAELDSGVLSVRVPRAEASKPVRIAVTNGG